MGRSSVIWQSSSVGSDRMLVFGPGKKNAFAEAKNSSSRGIRPRWFHRDSFLASRSKRDMFRIRRLGC